MRPFTCFRNAAVRPENRDKVVVLDVRKQRKESRSV